MHEQVNRSEVQHDNGDEQQGEKQYTIRWQRRRDIVGQDRIEQLQEDAVDDQQVQRLAAPAGEPKLSPNSPTPKKTVAALPARETIAAKMRTTASAVKNQSAPIE